MSENMNCFKFKRTEKTRQLIAKYDSSLGSALEEKKKCLEKVTRSTDKIGKKITD